MLKFISSVAVGLLFTALTYALATYYWLSIDTTSSWLGQSSRLAPLMAIIAAILGAVIGALSGAVVGGLRLNLLYAAVFGLNYSFIVFLILLYWSEGGDGNVMQCLYSTIPVNFLNAIIVSQLFVKKAKGDYFSILR